jgi:hypothetical protein
MRRTERTPAGRAARTAAAAILLLTFSPPLAVAAGAAPAGSVADHGIAPGGAGVPTVGLTQTLAPIDVHGGYVAAGTGLRNRGYGSIHLSGIPTGATVVRAYLYWTVTGTSATPGATFPNGKLDGSPIAGTLVGSGAGTCWSANHGFGYRADVSTLVHGNDDYALTNFRSADKNGIDPFVSDSSAPMADGASLVAVYEQPRYPRTRVVVADGYAATNSATATANVSWAFPATNPVPAVRTTTIGGGGQTGPDTVGSLGPYGSFDGFQQPTVNFDGSDPQPAPWYTHGNLWDTDTVGVGRRVRPGDTAATVTIGESRDCIAWVAQVLSIGFDGAADTDGDGLLDGWEANGNDADGNGTYDVNLQSMGASVVHKDVFVEMDTMGAESVCPCHLPLAPDLDRIVAAFATSPYADNPDGKPGIAIHLDAGPYRGAKYDLGGGNLVAHDDDLNSVYAEFPPIKAANFSTLRAKTFHYMVWAHGYEGGSSSGLSFGIGADSFIVTLGRWGGHGSSDAKVGTFIHELGHNLGLGHGGNDLVTNFKPNYLSVMNYFFQVTGVPQSGGRPSLFSYSRYKMPTLAESSLTESVGLGSSRAADFETRWFCPDDSIRQTTAGAAAAIDWNCDGTITAPVATDINNDDQKTTFGGWRDWGNLYFTGGTIGADGPGSGAPGFAPSTPTPTPHELTYEESLRLAR